MGQRASTSLSRRRRREEWFVEEQSRLLRWSAEVLARTDANVDAENSFLLDYEADSIAAKVDRWLGRDFDAECLSDVDVTKFANELKRKMSKEYEAAYGDLRRFGRRVDALAERQRAIHAKLLDLDPGQRQTKKLRRLGRKVVDNLRDSEKMPFRDRRLRARFVRDVYEIDRKCSLLCRARTLLSKSDRSKY